MSAYVSVLGTDTIFKHYFDHKKVSQALNAHII